MTVQVIDNLEGGFYHQRQLDLYFISRACRFQAAIISARHYRQRKALTLIKQDLIQRVVERTGLPRIKAESAVDAIFEAMKSALTASDRIELRGFGVFTVKPRKTGVGRNPRTGAEVSITPGKAVRFKPGKDLQLID
jgi:DNA-binding protein HU-beta